MSDLECRSELVVRERRGELSSAERVALDAHLGHCAACRLTRLLGRDFEAGATLLPDDGERISRLAWAAERWAEGRGGTASTVRPKRLRVRIALLAAAAALAAVGASAATGTWVKLFGEPSAPLPAVVQARAAAARPAAPERSTTMANDSVRVERTADLNVHAPRSTPAATATSLFKDANAARRSGNAARAVALYRRLEAEFPASPEAGLVEVPLGGLLLERGEARSALAQFDRHLGGAHGSRLLPEALYGRGRALSALGNRAEERRTWSTLLEQFPESPYAGHARRRLSDLTKAD